jgi:hypothetical protein
MSLSYQESHRLALCDLAVMTQIFALGRPSSNVIRPSQLLRNRGVSNRRAVFASASGRVEAGRD